MRTFAALSAAALLSGCATIIEGPSQRIAVTTDPPGATCGFWRGHDLIAKVVTPGAVTVDKTFGRITVNCRKDGYEQAFYQNRPEVAAATLGNAVIGGIVGAGIDAATGASVKYDSAVNLTLLPREPAAPAVATLAPFVPTM